MICTHCGSSSYLLVDGNEMALYDLLHLQHAPHSIKKRLSHALWCESFENRMKFAALAHRPPKEET